MAEAAAEAEEAAEVGEVQAEVAVAVAEEAAVAAEVGEVQAVAEEAAVAVEVVAAAVEVVGAAVEVVGAAVEVVEAVEEVAAAAAAARLPESGRLIVRSRSWRCWLRARLCSPSVRGSPECTRRPQMWKRCYWCSSRRSLRPSRSEVSSSPWRCCRKSRQRATH